MPRRQAVLPTDASRDDLEWDLGAILHALDGADVMDQAEPDAFYGWVVRRGDGAASVYLPEIGGAPEVRVVGRSDDLLDEIVARLTSAGSPLEGVAPMWGAAVDGTAPF